MIKQTMLPFKLKMSKEDITPRSGLALYAEFLRAIGIKEMVQLYMPVPGSNRGYGAWQFIEPLMLYGGGRHIEDVREIVEDKALRRLIGLRRMPQVGIRVLPEGKRIKHLSSDSALYQAEVINWCRRNKISFTVAADQDRSVKEAMGGIAEGDWKPLRDKEGVKSDREVADTVHCMKATEEAFRLVVCSGGYSIQYQHLAEALSAA